MVRRRMKSLLVLVLYCITFSLMLVFFYPIFTERQQLDPVYVGRDNKASIVRGSVVGREVQALARE